MASFSLTVEDSSPLISYAPAGAWTDSPRDDTLLPSYSGGSLHTTSAQGATATITFNGTGISVFGGQRPDYGTFRVTVDGRELSSGTSNKPANSFRQLLASASGLEHGRHVVVLTNTGGAPIDIDYADVQCEVGESGATMTQATFDDSDPRMTYLPSPDAWTTNTGEDFMGGTLRFSDAPNAAASMTFTGEAVAVYGTVSPDHANVKVSIDGREVTVAGGSGGVATSLHTRTLLWYTDKLGPEQHTIEISSDQQGPDARFLDIDQIAVFSAIGGSVVSTPNLVGATSTSVRSTLAPAPTNSEDDKSTPSAPASSGALGVPVPTIVGAVIGAIVGLLIILGLVFFCLRRRRQTRVRIVDGEAYPRAPDSPVLPMMTQAQTGSPVDGPIAPARALHHGPMFPEVRDSSIYSNSLMRPGSVSDTSQIIPFYDYSQPHYENNSQPYYEYTQPLSRSASIVSTTPMVKQPRPPSRSPVTYQVPSRPTQRPPPISMDFSH